MRFLNHNILGFEVFWWIGLFLSAGGLFLAWKSVKKRSGKTTSITVSESEGVTVAGRDIGPFSSRKGHVDDESEVNILVERSKSAKVSGRDINGE